MVAKKNTFKKYLKDRTAITTNRKRNRRNGKKRKERKAAKYVREAKGR